MAVPRSPFNPLFVHMLRVFGFALPPLPLRDACRACCTPAEPGATLAMRACWAPGAPGLCAWTQAKGFSLWFAVCAAAYLADALQTHFWGYHAHPMVVMCVWPPLYLAAQRQLTLLAGYRRALELMGAAGDSGRCCEPQCCQAEGCCGACSCCGCPCGRGPRASAGASAPLLHSAANDGSADGGRDKEERGAPGAAAAPAPAPLLPSKALQMLYVFRYRWSLGLGLLAYIAVLGCVIGVFGVNFIGQVLGGRLPPSASASVKLAVLCHGFLGSLNYGMLGPSIAAWVGSTWALMYCHKLQCWDWEDAVSAYREGATELQLRAAKEAGGGAAPGASPLAVGELTASSESEARFVDSAITAYTALREDLEQSHAVVCVPVYVFLAILGVLFVLGIRDAVLASLPIPHFGQAPMLVLAPLIAVVILYPLINLSMTLDKVIKSFSDKKFSWGALSLNSRVFISIHVDKHPLYYDPNISALSAAVTVAWQRQRTILLAQMGLRTRLLPHCPPSHLLADERAFYGLVGTAGAAAVPLLYPLVFPKG